MSRLFGAKLASKSPSPLSGPHLMRTSPPPPLSPAENLAPESPYSLPSHSPPLLSRLSTPISSPTSAPLSPLSPLDPLSPYIWDVSTDGPPSETSSYGNNSSTESQLSPPNYNFHPDYPPRLQIEKGRSGKPLLNMAILRRYMKKYRPTETSMWTMALVELKITTFLHRAFEMMWFIKSYLRMFRLGALEVVRGWGISNETKILDKLRELRTNNTDGNRLDVDSNLTDLFRLFGRERKLYKNSPKIFFTFNMIRNDVKVVRKANRHFMAA